jgi:hypothetical protein
MDPLLKNEKYSDTSRYYSTSTTRGKRIVYRRGDWLGLFMSNVRSTFYLIVSKKIKNRKNFSKNKSPKARFKFQTTAAVMFQNTFQNDLETYYKQ